MVEAELSFTKTSLQIILSYWNTQRPRPLMQISHFIFFSLQDQKILSTILVLFYFHNPDVKAF